MKNNLQRFGASVLAAAMVAQSVALPAAAETTTLDPSVAQAVAASAASAASTAQSLPKFTSTADLIKQTAQTLAAQGQTHELEQDSAKLDATVQSKAGMSLAALENALVDAMYANADSGKIETESYGLNKDDMASVMDAAIKKYHLSSSVSELGYQTNAAGVVTAVTFTASSGMTSTLESITTDSDEIISEQADTYAQAYVSENAEVFSSVGADHSHTYGEPKWYWNETKDGHTHTWNETPDGYWTKTDDGWSYTAVYTCKDGDGYQKVEGTVTKDTTDAKPGVAGKTVYSASVSADASPVKKEYKEPTTRTDDIDALPCQSHAVPKDADGNFVVSFNWEMKEIQGELAEDYSNAQLFYDSKTGKISVGAPVTLDWECTGITFTCATCGEQVSTQPMQTMPVSVVVDQNNNSIYINVGGTPTLDTTSGGMGVTLVADMKDGQWYDMQNNPVDASTINYTYTSGDNKGQNSLLLYDSQKTAVYVDDQGNQVTNTYDISTAQMNYYYFQLSEFNQDEADYFGVVAPYWTSKGVQKQGEDGSITGTMGAIKVLCSMDPDEQVPPTTMAFMLQFLPQGFMSYVMNYGQALLAMRDEGLAQVAKLGDNADYVTKLLILHDWVSQVAEFDMGSMGDITGGGSNDPIQMTAFGALLGGEIGASGVEYGCICLGYAAAYNYMVQNLPDNKDIYKNADGTWKTPDEVGSNAVVDFAQILYYCDTSDTSVAGNAFGGGMFNNVHYFNAVKVNKLEGDSTSAKMTTGEANKNWYYVDVCYDDVNTECMAQTRVENSGDLRHVNFLVSPSGLEGRYSKYYDYIDSLYDGYTYTKNADPDKDDNGNVVMNNGKPHYSYTKTENKDETRYTDTCYEDTWFTSICSPIYFDDNYFYYVDTTTNQNLYNNMRRQQSESGNSGSSSSGSSSSGNNSQMQQFMKKMQNQGPDTLEARPRNADYYIRPADSSSGSSFSMSSFTKTDDPYDIILMYYNDLKETSNSFTDDDSNAKVLANAGTIYKIDTSATDKHTQVENNLNTECLADAAAKLLYPALVHSTALYEGKLYFNLNNAIYRMDPTTGAVEEVKEYNTVYGGIKLTKDSDGNMVPDTHFPGMSMIILPSAKDTSSAKYIGTFQNHPLAGLTLRDSYSFKTEQQNGQNVITGINTTKNQLIVSVGTNLSNTYKSLDELDEDGKPVVKTDDSGLSYDQRKSYKTESWNYNPNYNQNMGSSDEKNKNEEFMWCANLVESMDMATIVSELSSGSTKDVSVDAWCDSPAYTQARTTNYGLCKGEKKYADGALPKGHTWKLNDLETKSVGNDVYLCDDCHTATESTPHTVTLPESTDNVTLKLGTTNNQYIKDDTVTLTMDKTGTDVITVTASAADGTEVALTEVQDETATQATTENSHAVYNFTMPDSDVTIKVEANAKTYDVTVASMTNGTVTAAPAKAAEGEAVTLTVKPADKYALKADSLKVTYTDKDGNEQTAKVSAGTEANTYTFTMPAYAVNVSAEFEATYTITVDAKAQTNGKTEADAKTAVAGTTVTITATASDGYELKADSLKVTAGDKTVETKAGTAANTFTFTMPAADVTITAEYAAQAPETYSVTVNEATNGTVTADKKTAAAGDTVTLTVEPADGKTILAQLAENGLKVADSKGSAVETKAGTDGTYTFTMPADNVTVTAQFEIVEYGVEISPVTNGSVTLTENKTRFKAGTEVTATITANDGYVLKTVYYQEGNNGTDVTSKVVDGKYTFTMPANYVKIEATFEVKPTESTEPTTPDENGGDNTETEALEAEERTVHGASEKTTVTAMAVFTCTNKDCASAQFVDATVKQTSGETTATVNFNGKDYTAKYGVKNGWVEENGKKYWYEDGVKQGTEGRGKEIYDPASDAWYWLDAVQGGAMTVSKDVYQESAAGQWADREDGTGKWVRYDENGHMVKGWQTTEEGTYYFDLITGAMAKGTGDIDGVPCAFDKYTGIALDGQWLTINGADYWYEKGVRQGLDGRGKEIYDPASDAWYWLDAVDQGKKATSKDVYQESAAGQWADRADGTGKWVRYDAQGHMIKGWSADKRYYFDPVYGTMAKGDANIDGRTYHFDKNTGVCSNPPA